MSRAPASSSAGSTRRPRAGPAGRTTPTTTSRSPVFTARVEAALARAAAAVAGRRHRRRLHQRRPDRAGPPPAARGRRRDLWLRLNQVTVNTGVTKLVVGTRGITLLAVNEHTHLAPDRRHLPIGTPMSTILITGASSGLGAEMARQFAALGYDLALCARRTDNLEALRAEIAAAHPGVRVEVRALDVNDHDAVFGVFGEFRDRLRHPRPGRRQRRPRQGPAARHRPLRRQPRDRADQLHRRPGADRGRRGDLPRAERRPPRDDLLDLGDARDAAATSRRTPRPRPPSPTSPRASAPT